MGSGLEQFQAMTRSARRPSWKLIRDEIGRDDPDLLAGVEAALADGVTGRPQIAVALQKLGYDIGKMGVENWRHDVLSR
jgi:hypothetical protein